MHTSEVFVSIVLATKLPATLLRRALERPRIHMLGLDVSHRGFFCGDWTKRFTFTALLSASKMAMSISV